MKRIDLRGMRIGRLLVLAPTGNRGRDLYWDCLCACGAQVEVRSRCLRYGETRSCGCLQKELAAQRNYKHGAAIRGRESPEYIAWSGLRRRCYVPGEASYKNYGGRGITVDPRWLGKHGFENFLEDMGRRPGPGYSIERKKNELGYSKDNCVWATRLEQANNRRNNRWVEFDGERLTLPQLARKYFPQERVETARARLRARIYMQGMSVEQAVTQPVTP
jgi:hypothetical protein